MVQVCGEETLGSKVMKVGDRVRVKESVIVYHHPEHRNQPFDIKGLEGDVLGIVNEWHGRPVSANLPVYVQFSKKFKAHLRENEVEPIS
ncbi:MAG: Ferredoxin-thioredoxin reductase, variable chain [Chroococcidiopsis cubana SAG 39.79]|uniref:Ferredoxin thioredoxin reductase alpha chain n=3 Tax=Cyanophyceae TaxID=3028117 RepID=K9U6W5_CHRTP|nr:MULTISPECIES: ferredoxin-thioredoxin reductase variable chain [Chroococcidiopsis]AFY90580.1 ferredoxin thioredoxin reductase alpha chain [Chroococcidiopsis thermalis PCC 7203]MDV2991912.1 Ferredoxin-thioredoxin reductase, variable chain [Chroococcidiopsis sp. SAG 2025]MDZ4878314.1 Ferredoxin-thioredoxin reductase, variable chain [Chroococcidiopsis cubana SAG 39.79]RUT14321.1 ferredoxin--nitrite reductase [Chroococcidiopsis cubana SAG 39.79]URD50095.1 ferredoxin-thioredoxin reductase variabl